MADQSSLHLLRQSIGYKRQPPHELDLRELHQAVADLGYTHPYELEYDARVQLQESKPAYRQGGRGISAVLNASDRLYRISSARALITGVSDLRLGGITKDDNDEVIWNALNEPRYTGNWRSLSRYSRGTLTGRRGISWWTTLTLDPRSIVAGGLQMGMYAIWIPRYAVILRLSIDELIKPLIPTVLDAFDQEVFRPARYSDNPIAGTTISLKQSGNLVDGTTEFILLNVPVEQIELIPVLVNAPMRAEIDSVKKGPETWGLLEQYLRAM